MKKEVRTATSSSSLLVSRKGRRNIWTSMLWLAALFIIGACSSSQGSSSNAQKTEGITATVQESAAKADVEAKGQPGMNKSSVSPVAKPERKLIYEANLSMEVKDYEATKQQMNRLIELSGGYVLKFEDERSDFEHGGSYEIKVPAQGFHSFLDKLGSWEYVNFDRKYAANDVTEEYVDLTARLKARKVVEERLLSYMENAKTSQDLIKFSDELGKVQLEIEQLTGRMRYLDNNVAMSTIHIRLYQIIKQVPKDVIQDAFGTQIGDTLKASWSALTAVLRYTILLIVALLPFAIVGAIIWMPIWYVIKKGRQVRGGKQYGGGKAANPERQKSLDVLNAKIQEVGAKIKAGEVKENDPKDEHPNMDSTSEKVIDSTQSSVKDAKNVNKDK
ncbi:DUF4349 domain-containing protein [Paenibacillus sp. 481]|uniref:DUF4349 domain-containing protein n=1 Tax=Paenibacillus sp. 481 TaxID=2835869 RepID=UPI001E4ED7D0|nr:DUF4349 domain-containing protein [Paenibacillus sp. 481]UHA74133.1 DUF4349 domain-containing protein [Paenibacillus sp. 481]